jgi:hypothetical protein
MVTEKRSEWDIDLFLCVLLVLIPPYAIFDILIRPVVKMSLFQTSWIIVSFCIVRLFIILLDPSRSLSIRIKSVIKHYNPLAIIVIYTFFLTILFVLNPYEALNSTSANLTYEPFKFVFSRGLKYLAYVGLSVYVAITLKNRKRISLVVRYLSFGLCVAEVLALLQFSIFQVSRYNIFPVVRTNVEEKFRYMDALVNFSGFSFLRLSSISHEPKGLAMLMCLLLIIKLFWKTFQRDYFFTKTRSKLDTYITKTTLITPIVMFLTFSNNALFMLGFIALFLIVLNMIEVFSRRKYKLFAVKSTQLILAAFAISFALLAFINYGNEISSVISSFLDATLGRRLGSDILSSDFQSLQGSVDPEDGSVLYIFENYPILSILRGFGFGGFSNLAYPYVQASYNNDFVSPFSRNILIELFFSSGIIGCCLAVFFFRSVVGQFFSCRSSIHLIFGAYVMLNVFLRSSEVLFFVSLGILVSCSCLETANFKLSNPATVYVR